MHGYILRHGDHPCMRSNTSGRPPRPSGHPPRPLMAVGLHEGRRHVDEGVDTWLPTDFGEFLLRAYFYFVRQKNSCIRSCG
jgi:hypothetical protein